jgi:uncharacterized protein
VAQIVIFLGIVLVVVFGIHYYLWWRLVRSTTRPGRGRKIGAWLIVAADLVLIATLTLTRLDTRLDWLAAIGYIWLAVMFYLLVTLVVLEIPAAVAKRLADRKAPAVPDAGALTPGALTAKTLQDVASDATDRTPGGSPTALPAAQRERLPGERSPADRTPGGSPTALPAGRISRRLLISRTTAVAASVIAAGTTGYGVTQALGGPQLKRRQITLAKLPRSMDGYRIALVSDIHLGPLAGRAHTQRIVDVINRLNADIVTVVGDLVDGTVEQLGAAAEPLRGLRHRDGAYFVTGNHEYFSGYEPWLVEVAELGLKPLRNERVALPGGLDLAGVNDAIGGNYGDAPDYAKALADRDPAKAVVLLAHQPIQVSQAANFGVDLQLSGHTHGGQMVPFNLIVGLQQPVVSGYDVVRWPDEIAKRAPQGAPGVPTGTQIYVTNGAGFWGPPVRVGAPPDVTLVELRSI